MATRVAFVFPGQGAQHVGMGKALAEHSAAAQAVFAEADQTLGVSLTKVMWEGTLEELSLTENAQPAILAVSVAAWRALTERHPLVPAVAAGHSLGEYTALVCAGALSLADALRLVRARGRYMQQAVPVGRGAMAAVIGLPPGKIDQVLAQLSSPEAPVTVAGYNSPDQTTIAGDKEAVARASEALTAAGAKRVIALQVSAPFHCPLMAPVEAPLRREVEAVRLGSFAFPVVSNVDAQPNADTTRVVGLLIDQLTRPVRWVQSIRAMQALGAQTLVEMGPGRALCGMIKKVDRTLNTLSIEDPPSLDQTVTALT